MINLLLWPVLYVVALWGLGQVTTFAPTLVSVLAILIYLFTTKNKEYSLSTQKILLTLGATAILVVTSALLTDKQEVTKLTFLNVVILAPIAEEIVFRELSFKRSQMGPIVAAVVSTALFAVAHGLDINVIIASAIAGFTLCALYYLTDALVCTIIAHILANLILVFI